MRRSVALAVACVLVVAPVSGVVTVGSAATTDVAVQSVDLSVDQPAPGEPFTLTTTIANLESSSGSVDVTDVYVRKSGTTTEYGRIENVGAIAAGQTLDVPLTLSIGSTGGKRLTIHAVVRDADGDTKRVNYPLYVDVEEPDEAVVSFATPDLVAGQESRVNVSVSNGDDATLSNVRLDVAGDATVDNPERVSAAIASGAQVTHQYHVTFPEAGQRALDATLTYKTSEGVTRTTNRNVTVDVAESNIDAALTVTPTAANGSSAIEASLTEYGNVELRDVEVRALSGGDVVARALAADVPAEGTRTATLDGSSIPAGDVTIRAAYTAAGERRSVERTLQYSPRETAEIALTGVDFTRDGAAVGISGDTANLGSADAGSLLVSVGERDGVSPVPPNAEYFVGSVESSEFATFEVTASVDEAVDRVPLTISYSVNGERHSRVATVDLGQRSAPGEGGSGGSGSGGIPWLGVGALLAVVVGGVAVYRWRR
ncbi:MULTISPECIES: hypothetical protein [Halobacterium]|uniref:hypothetical protein n=1 Tax=Halobacterium TaxID=2239 RepID=UPI0012F893B7|nr:MULTISPECIES: hypothetical protein [Halobacterium]MCG1003202.1 hypothetical protein [Halobacterium noricense]